MRNESIWEAQKRKREEKRRADNSRVQGWTPSVATWHSHTYYDSPSSSCDDSSSSSYSSSSDSSSDSCSSSDW